MDANSLPATALQADRDPYMDLDDSVRLIVSRREWEWLSDREKATLEQDLCEPDSFGD